jgi:CheY-like chemotaxis protein
MIKNSKGGLVATIGPFIAVTAAAMPQEMKAGKEAGFSAYLVKPIKFDDFLKVIGGALKERN